MKRDVQKFTAACTFCQKFKVRRAAKLTKLEPVQLPMRPGDSYNIDFITDLPASGSEKHDFCLIVVDRFSQRVFSINSWKTVTGEQIAKQFYDEIVCNQGMGFPKELISDRDSRFTGNFWRA
eukprot:SAG11_NODE_13741_length_641_cov_2.287823_1_plen_121_part_01